MTHSPDPSLTAEPVTIQTPGATLRGTLFLPPAPSAAVMINAATGVKAGFYAPFARWLAETTGRAVLIWDYRDFAASAASPKATRRSPATMTDWGVADPVAVRAWMAARFPGLPLWLIGHSLGGMTLPFQPGNEALDRAILVASGPAYVADHPWPYQGQVRLMWWGIGPLALAALGYLPGSRLGLGNDLPAGVFRQWKRWCTDRRSILADPDMPPIARPGLRCPVTLVALADDIMIVPQAVFRMEGWITGTTPERRLLVPRDFGLAGVGHIAAFAPKNRALWPALIA